MAELNKLSSDIDIYGGQDLSSWPRVPPSSCEIGRDSLAATMLPITKTCAAASMPSTVASACCACVHADIYIHCALKCRLCLSWSTAYRHRKSFYWLVLHTMGVVLFLALVWNFKKRHSVYLFNVLRDYLNTLLPFKVHPMSVSDLE